MIFYWTEIPEDILMSLGILHVTLCLKSVSEHTEHPMPLNRHSAGCDVTVLISMSKLIEEVSMPIII